MYYLILDVYSWVRMNMQSLSYTRFKPGAVTGVADALHIFFYLIVD